MTCNIVKLDGGGVAFACGPRIKQPCVVCGWPGDRLCDFRHPSWATCDARLCRTHATSGGANIDFCPPHKEKAGRQGALAW